MNSRQPARLYTENPGHSMPRVFLTEATYTEAIASFIVVCTDAIIIDSIRKTVWLATRRHLPMRGLWIIGGRRFAGETIEASIERCFTRETGLTLPGRFTYLLQNEYKWSSREQVPQDVGSHTIGDTFSIELTSEERDIVSKNLDREEYEAVGLQEFDRNGLIAAGAHQALIDLYDAIYNT